MNVCMLTAGYHPGYEGGAERQCRKLVRALEATGTHCTVVTLRTSWRLPAHDEVDGVPVRRIGSLAPLEHALKRLWSSVERLLWRCPVLSAARAKPVTSAIGFWLLCPLIFVVRLTVWWDLRRAFAASRIAADVIHVHEASWLAGLGALVADRMGIPVLCKEASNPVLWPVGYDTPMRRRLDMLRRTCFFVAQTPAANDGLQREGVDAARLETVPNGVELPDLGTRGVTSAGDVLYIGNFSQGAHWKAFDVLLDAWAMVSREEPSARLTMVGGGDSSAWQTYARQLGCADSVCFAGSTQDPDAYYRAASLLVLPSRVEGMSNVLLEAMSWGLPVVVSDIPGNVAVVAHERDGLVAPVADADALAAAIVRLVRDAALRERLGSAARATVERQFALGTVAGRYAELYGKLAGTQACAS